MKPHPILLGIETSCDECSAAVVEIDAQKPSGKVLSESTHTQEKLHQPYGGVVPEIASRDHLEFILPMVESALDQAKLSPADLDGIAVTNRPGLVGALLVGVTAAKSLAYAFRKPLVPVHHLEGHALSVFLDQPVETPAPALIAVVSGGHTNLYVADKQPLHWEETFLEDQLVGRSRDDAAGEAFDKIAKLIGFPYPGGRWIDKKSEGGDPNRFSFPRALPQKSLIEFSFSGLKTAAAQQIQQKPLKESDLADFCASVQEAIVDALWSKMKLAIQKYDCKSCVLVGGVAANRRLRTRIQEESPVPVHFPLPRYCTDNASMIALAGGIRMAQNRALVQEEMLRLNATPGAVY